METYLPLWDSVCRMLIVIQSDNNYLKCGCRVHRVNVLQVKVSGGCANEISDTAPTTYNRRGLTLYIS